MNALAHYLGEVMVKRGRDVGRSSSGGDWLRSARLFSVFLFVLNFIVCLGVITRAGVGTSSQSTDQDHQAPRKPTNNAIPSAQLRHHRGAAGQFLRQERDQIPLKEVVSADRGQDKHRAHDNQRYSDWRFHFFGANLYAADFQSSLALVYTGITRGKKLVVVVGQRKALAIAVRNNKTEQRFSGLLARLLVPS
jgi:hypothetical protein